MLIIVMGVSGCGKTTVGRLLAELIDGEFFDADDFHTQDNVEKMRKGIPLTDADRAGWLSTLHDFLAKRQPLPKPTVLACSALKRSYRRILSEDIVPPPRIVFLKGPFETIHGRMKARDDHYMPSSLLRSQFEALEEPSGAISVDVGGTPESIATEVCIALGL